MKRVVLSLAAGLFAIVAASAIAEARPGGGGGGGGGGGSHGSTYRPSIYRSSHSSGGGAGVGPGTVIAVILGLGVTVALVLILSDRGESRTIQQTAAANALAWDALYAADPAFSRVAFERQVRELYKAAQRARHDAGELAKLGPQLSEAAREELAKAISPVDAVRIDSVRIVEAGATTIECMIAAVHLLGGAVMHMTSRWSFARRDGAWILDRVVEVGTGNALNLVGMGPEVGNDLPTISDDDAITTFLEMRDASGKIYGWADFDAYVKTVFARIADAWNQRQPALAQDLVTSEVIEYLELWLDEHRRQGLVNHHDNPTVRHIGLAKVVREASFDVVTVRVYAQGLDYTTKLGGGDVVGGSRTEPRSYTEYWTFVRAKDAGDFKLASIVQDELYAG